MVATRAIASMSSEKRLMTAMGVEPMPRMRKKSELPVKICPVCGRPFAWRKRWAKDWAQVVYCSQACRRRGAAASSGTVR